MHRNGCHRSLAALRCLAILVPLLLQGCLSTWIRMEDGTVLQPGKSDFSVAYGTVPRPSYKCSGSGYANLQVSSGDIVCEEYNYDWRLTDTGYVDLSTRTITPASRRDVREPHFGFAWRLGLLGPFGPFAGLEAGMQAEGATNPMSQEFKLALGLPGSDSLVAHSLIAGWGIGMWTDNSWFVQYAASRRFGQWRFYGSTRATLQATQPQSTLDTTMFVHKRSWDYQIAGGVKVHLGEVRVIPDWLLAGATVDLGHSGYPTFDVSEARQPSGIGVAYAIGMGWTW